MRLQYKIGDIVKINNGRYCGEIGIVKSIPNDVRHAYVVATEGYQYGFWAYEHNMEPYEVSEDLSYLLEEKYWDQFIPENVDPGVFFWAMVEIYPAYLDIYNIDQRFRVCIFPGDAEGPIPNMHVFYEGKQNKSNTAYICLGKAEYAPQYKKETKVLNVREIKDLITFLNSKIPEFIDSNEPTCWEYAVKSWLCGKDKKYLSDWKKYFDLDANEHILMPDYLDLKI